MDLENRKNNLKFLGEARKWHALLMQLKNFETTIEKKLLNIKGEIEILQKYEGSDTDIICSETRDFLSRKFSQFETDFNEKFEVLENYLGNVHEIIQSDCKSELSAKEYMGLEIENLEQKDQIKLAKDQSDSTQDCEIMTFDPILSNVQIGQYDGNPAISFSAWIAKFKDTLDLMLTPLSEAQKIARLRVSLIGRPRAIVDALDPKNATLENAILLLRENFENSHSRAIAKQVLSGCKQNLGEKVFSFANRLNQAVRACLARETETNIQARLFDEFLDRLETELQFEVKKKMPKNYNEAFELAQHFELLMEARGKNLSVYVADPESDRESSHRARNNRQRCFYCKSTGHFIRDCNTKKRDEREENYRKFRKRENSSSESESESRSSSEESDSFVYDKGRVKKNRKRASGTRSRSPEYVGTTEIDRKRAGENRSRSPPIIGFGEKMPFFYA